ncbi:hypothetical protein Tco_0320365 [Tanacetum coccineum]
MEVLMKGNDKDSSSGTDIPISVVPIAIKPPSIANWKIIKLGKKGVYLFIREDGIYTTYINFGAMLKSISKDDLTELYRLVMQSYGTNGPGDEYERVFWRDLKTMFDLPLTDIYMLTERRYPLPAEVCQAMLNKKLQGDNKDEACYQLGDKMLLKTKSQITKLPEIPGQSLILPLEEVNAKYAGDKSLSETAVNPILKPKETTNKRLKKKKISSSSEPKASKDVRDTPKEQVTVTQSAEEPVSIADIP